MSEYTEERHSDYRGIEKDGVRFAWVESGTHGHAILKELNRLASTLTTQAATIEKCREAEANSTSLLVGVNTYFSLERLLVHGVWRWQCQVSDGVTNPNGSFTWHEFEADTPGEAIKGSMASLGSASSANGGKP